jgi:pimeloyl-ACP methyl ester carboxylesterase
MAYISIQSEKLHYVQMGSGPCLLLAFHGYGEDAERFRLFEQYLGHEYTLLSFDLPHHGESKWNDKKTLTAEGLTELINTVKSTFVVEKVSLLGYSIGGRVCLAIVAALPESIEKILLMGTDGLKINSFYYFFTRTFLGKWLFLYMLSNPGLCFTAAGWLRRLRLISATQFRLVVHSIQSDVKRRLLMRVWPCLSSLVYRTATLRAIVKRHSLPIVIYMGAHDKLLPPMLAERFAEGLSGVRVFIPQKGHRIFDSENVREIAQKLL